MSNLTNEQKVHLELISVWEPRNFPNGSSYKRQTLPEGSFGGVTIKKSYGSGYYITWPDRSESYIPFRWVSTGKGADLGVHFCTRDQALAIISQR